MSDISMPPEQTPASPANPKKKYLLDNVAVKFVVLLMGYISPLPVAVMIAQLWLQKTGNDATSALHVINDALDGVSSAPQWIWPLAYLPAVILFIISFKSTGGKIAALVSLLAVSFAIIALFFQSQPEALL